MDEKMAILLIAGFILGYVILYTVIGHALDSTRRQITEELKVQNQLLRKSLSINSPTEEILEENYGSGYYTAEHYKKLKKIFKI